MDHSCVQKNWRGNKKWFKMKLKTGRCYKMPFYMFHCTFGNFKLFLKDMLHISNRPVQPCNSIDNGLTYASGGKSLICVVFGLFSPRVERVSSSENYVHELHMCLETAQCFFSWLRIFLMVVVLDHLWNIFAFWYALQLKKRRVKKIIHRIQM